MRAFIPFLLIQSTPLSLVESVDFSTYSEIDLILCIFTFFKRNHIEYLQHALSNMSHPESVELVVQIIENGRLLANSILDTLIPNMGCIPTESLPQVLLEISSTCADKLLERIEQPQTQILMNTALQLTTQGSENAMISFWCFIAEDVVLNATTEALLVAVLKKQIENNSVKRSGLLCVT